MNQREQAAALIAEINLLLSDVHAPLEAALNRLDNVLDYASNAPPLGMADGSIDEVMFDRLRDFARSSKRALLVFRGGR